MMHTGDFVEDPDKRLRIRTLRWVRLMIVREIINTNIDMEGMTQGIHEQRQEHAQFSMTVR